MAGGHTLSLKSHRPGKEQFVGQSSMVSVSTPLTVVLGDMERSGEQF